MSDYDRELATILERRHRDPGSAHSRRYDTFSALNVANDLVDGGPFRLFWVIRDALRWWFFRSR